MILWVPIAPVAYNLNSEYPLAWSSQIYEPIIFVYAPVTDLAMAQSYRQ